MKSMFYRVIQIALMIVLLSVSGFAQEIQNFYDQIFETYNFDFNGNGARAMGMGNAYLGVSDDIYAIGWNPAGLYKMESPIIGLTYTSLNSAGKFSSNRINTTSVNIPSERLEIGHNDNNRALTSVNFLAPLRIKGHPFVGSIAYTRNSNEFRDQAYKSNFEQLFPIFNEVGAFLREDTILGEVSTSTKLLGGINAINIGFGTRIRSKLAWGLSLNVYSGKANRDTHSLGTANGVPLNNFQQANGEIDQTIIDSNSFSGFNLTIGLKHEGEKLDAGLVVRTPFSLNQKSENFRSEFLSVNGVPLFTDTTFRIDLLTKYDIPMIVGLGVGYHYSESWLFALDLEYRNFSSSKIKIRENLILVPGGSNIEEFRILSDQVYNNVFIVRVGTEYLKKTGIGTIPVRAGLGYVPLPIANVNINGERSTSLSYQFSLGTGIHWNQIKLDLGYMYKTYNQKTTYFDSEDNAQNHFLNASFTGNF